MKPVCINVSWASMNFCLLSIPYCFVSSAGKRGKQVKSVQVDIGCKIIVGFKRSVSVIEEIFRSSLKILGLMN